MGAVRRRAWPRPFLSAQENIELSLALRGITGASAWERALEALAAVGLVERGEQRTSRLRAGERQRAAIARAPAVQPSLLLADEPTARLDQANALAVASLLARLAPEQGIAIVYATDDRSSSARPNTAPPRPAGLTNERRTCLKLICSVPVSSRERGEPA